MTEWCTTDDGCRLAYSHEGATDGEVLILANSLGTTRELWEAPAAALASTFKVVRFDNRGHGESDAPEGDYTVERMSRDVLALLDHLGVERAHVAGVSIGGQMALWLAAYAPTRVRRAVLLNTGARIQHTDFWQQRIDRARTEGLEAMADGVIGRWFTAGFAARAPETVARFRRTLASTPPAGYAGCCAALRDADLRDAAATVTLPTLVVVGRHDQATTPDLGEWLRDHTPGAALVEVEAGHLSPVEAPEDVAAAMRAFLTA